MKNLLALLVLTLVGCTNTNVTQSIIDDAIELCGNNGKLNKIVLVMEDNYRVYCKNSAVFYRGR